LLETRDAPRLESLARRLLVLLIAAVLGEGVPGWRAYSATIVAARAGGRS